MRVYSWEEGDRPVISTRARRFAPDAKRAFVNMLSGQDWADVGYVVLDWNGTIAFVDGSGMSHDDPNLPALDRRPPVMYIQAIKALPQLGGSAVVEHIIDIDNVFGGVDVVTAADLSRMVVQLKDELDLKVQDVRRHKEVNR